MKKFLSNLTLLYFAARYIAEQYQSRSTYTRLYGESIEIGVTPEVHVSATCNWFTLAKSQTFRYPCVARPK